MRLYLPDGHYFIVKVFKTKAGMIRFHERRFGEPVEPFEAICAGYTRQKLVNGRWKTLMEMGHILFHDGSVKIGIIAHEATHAALRWHELVHGKTLRLSSKSCDVNDREEKVAHLVGLITIKLIALLK